MAWPEAEDLLLGLVVRARSGEERPGQGGVPPWFEGATQALEAVGALSSTEAAAWRARVEREADERDAGDHAVASQTTRRRAGEMLEDCLVPARSRRAREANEERFETLLAACEVASVFSPPEIEAWLERVANVRGVPGPVEAREELPSAAELLAVVPGPPAGEGELRVRWVELFADAVVVHWVETVDLGGEPPARGEERLMRDTRTFELADDRGRAFAHQGGEAALRRLGTKRALVGRTGFSPGVTPEAEQLELRNPYTGEHVASIPLPT